LAKRMRRTSTRASEVTHATTSPSRIGPASVETKGRDMPSSGSDRYSSTTMAPTTTASEYPRMRATPRKSSTEVRFTASGPQLDANVAGLGEETHRLQAALAAQAGLAHAAERRAQVAHEPAVDPDDAGVDAGGEAVGAGEVARPDRRGQAVVDGIGQRQRLCIVVEGLQGRDRTEDFLAVARAVGVEAFEQRWRDEPAGAVERATAAQHAAAFLARPRDGRDDLVEVRLRNQRAHLRVRIHRVADAQG